MRAVGSTLLLAMIGITLASCGADRTAAPLDASVSGQSVPIEEPSYPDTSSGDGEDPALQNGAQPAVAQWDVTPPASWVPKAGVTGLNLAPGTAPGYTAEITIDNNQFDGTLSIALRDANGSPIYDTQANTRGATWSSSNANVLTVTRSTVAGSQPAFNAIVDVKSGGEATISLKLHDGTGANVQTMSLTLTVTNRAVTSLKITPDVGLVQVGETLRLTVMAVDGTGASRVPDRQITFSTSSSAVRLTPVSGSQHMVDVTGVTSGGSATITASGYGLSGYAGVAVAGPPVFIDYAGSPASPPRALLGSVCTNLEIIRRDFWNHLTTQGGDVNFTSSNPAAVSVTNTGPNTGRACAGADVGAARITATVIAPHGPVSTNWLVITRYRVTAIELTPTSLQLPGTESATINAVVRADGGNGIVALDPTLGPGLGLTWLSGNTTLVQVVQGNPRSALVRGQSVIGTTQVTASLDGVTGNVNVSTMPKLVVVLAGPDAAMESRSDYTWQAQAQGGIGPLSYHWEFMSQTDPWTQLLDQRYRYPYSSTTTTIVRTVDCATQPGIVVRVRVTSADGQVAYAERRLFYTPTPTSSSTPCTYVGRW